MRLETDGRLALPAEACAALGWRPGDVIEASLDGDTLRLHRPADQLVNLRGAFAQALVDWGVSEEGARQAAAGLPDPRPGLV